MSLISLAIYPNLFFYFDKLLLIFLILSTYPVRLNTLGTFSNSSFTSLKTISLFLISLTNFYVSSSIVLAFNFNLLYLSVFAYTYSLNSYNFYTTSDLCSSHSLSIFATSTSYLLFASYNYYYAYSSNKCANLTCSTLTYYSFSWRILFLSTTRYSNSFSLCSTSVRSSIYYCIASRRYNNSFYMSSILYKLRRFNYSSVNYFSSIYFYSISISF